MTEQKKLETTVMTCDLVTGVITWEGHEIPTPIRTAEEFKKQAEHWAALGKFRIEFPNEVTAHISEVPPPQPGEIRTKYGQEWRWVVSEDRAECGHPMPPHWRTMGGTTVVLFPPTHAGGPIWCMFACDKDDIPLPTEHHHFMDFADGEEEAFKFGAELAKHGPGTASAH